MGAQLLGVLDPDGEGEPPHQEVQRTPAAVDEGKHHGQTQTGPAHKVRGPVPRLGRRQPRPPHGGAEEGLDAKDEDKDRVLPHDLPPGGPRGSRVPDENVQAPGDDGQGGEGEDGVGKVVEEEGDENETLHIRLDFNPAPVEHGQT